MRELLGTVTGFAEGVKEQLIEEGVNFPLIEQKFPFLAFKIDNVNLEDNPVKSIESFQAEDYSKPIVSIFDGFSFTTSFFTIIEKVEIGHLVGTTQLASMMLGGDILAQINKFAGNTVFDVGILAKNIDGRLLHIEGSQGIDLVHETFIALDTMQDLEDDKMIEEELSKEVPVSE